MILWSGQAVSSAGTWASQVAFPLLVLAITHSALQAGLTGALERVPFLLLTLPAGALVDRWNRKRAMIVCDSIRALAFAAIPLADWSGHLGMPLIYVVVLIEGTAFSVFNLAETSALPRVVPPEQLPAATAQNQASFAGALLVGPPLAGLLFQIRRGLPFLADAVSYAVSALSLLFIRTRFEGARRASTRAMRTEIREGIVWLWRQPLLRTMAALSGGFNFLDGGWALVLIVLAQKELHASPGAIGLVFGLGAIGEIFGAAAGAQARKRLSYGHAIAGATWAFAIVWTLVGLAPNLVVVAVLVAAAGFVIPTFDVVQFSYRLALIPDELQGRVNSIYRLVAIGTLPAGQAMAGGLLQGIGPRPTILLVGGGYGILALVSTFSPPIRHAPSIEEARARIAEGQDLVGSH
jgi:MFS family permease